MPAPHSLSRRHLLAHAARLGVASMTGSLLTACFHSEPPVRVVANVWPGYELLYVAEKQKLFGNMNIQMHTMPSATACLQALASGSAEAAGLTLDEVLTARSEDMPLTVIAVLDISHGGDVVLARPEVKDLAGLRNKRIGVEQSAVGAVMLAAVLKEAGLGKNEVEIVHATVDRHLEIYRNHSVDALVTFQPLPRQMEPGEAITLFDSTQTPNRIIDVLAVRPEVLKRSPGALRALVAGHFKALQTWNNAPARIAPEMSERLAIDVSGVIDTFQGILLPDATANREWLAGEQSRLLSVAEELQQFMLSTSLLAQPASLQGLADSRFLP